MENMPFYHLMVACLCCLQDEPTNHLDLEACVWLEEHLKKFKRILLMVSHSQVGLGSAAELTVTGSLIFIAIKTKVIV